MLKIDPDFKSFIPALSPEEFKQLEQNILSENCCREAILTWKGFIIDGHNRYTICQKHNIPFKVSKLCFASKNDALIWIADNQLGRRNLSDATRIELASRRVKLLKDDKSLHVRKAIASAAGVSEQMVHRYMKIVGSADSEMIAKVRKGETKINNAYNKLMIETRTVREINVIGEIRKDVQAYCDVIRGLANLGKFIEFLGLVVDCEGLDWGEFGEWLEVGFGEVLRCCSPS